MKENCEHNWKEIERREVVKQYIKPTFFANGLLEREIKILQQCEKCKILNTVTF